MKTAIELLANLAGIEHDKGLKETSVVGCELAQYAAEAPAVADLEHGNQTPAESGSIFSLAELNDRVIDYISYLPGPLAVIDGVNARLHTDSRLVRTVEVLKARSFDLNKIFLTQFRLPIGYRHRREMQLFIQRMWTLPEIAGHKCDLEWVAFGPAGIRRIKPGELVFPLESRLLVVKGEENRRLRIHLAARALRATFESDCRVMDLIAEKGGSVAKCFIEGAMLEPISGLISDRLFMVGAAMPWEPVVDMSAACLLAPNRTNAAYFISATRISDRIASNAVEIDKILADIYEIERWLCWAVNIGDHWSAYL